VANPELYKWYSVEEAVSCFGSPDDARYLCDDQWVILPKTAICLAEIGPHSKHKPADTSYFSDGARFCWLADRPYEVSNSPLAHFVPDEATAWRRKEYTLWLFVRPPHVQKYIYVGKLSPSHVLVFSRHENRGIATFGLEPTLPSDVGMQLGVLKPGKIDVATLDRALGRLRHPATVDDRIAILRQLIEFWHGPIRPEDGMSDTEITSLPMPLPLRWWYGFAGKRAEIMSCQNILFVPRDFTNPHRMLRIVNDRLLFYVENQGVHQWSTLQHGDDPPVFSRREGRGRWAKEAMTLFQHLILMCLFEAVTCHAHYRAHASWLDEDRLAAVIANISPLAIQPWRWGGMRFFVEKGVFVCVADNPADDLKKWYSVTVAAATEQPLQFLKPLIDDRWDSLAL
jgi:hypothetical protein